MTNAVAIAQQGSNNTTFRNRIINGAMVIDQRNAGASVTPSGAVYNIDRWWTFGTQSSKFSIQQNAGSVTPPAGFTNYLGVTSLSAYSVTSTDQFILAQWIEGFNASDLGWGTANAKTVTLSFQVYSSLTGTFAGCIQNYSNNRSYPFTYTVSSANTWTPISITIAGDTTGTWGTTNTGFGGVIFSLGAGSTYQSTANTWVAGNYKSVSGATSVVGTNGATFYITGVQLEAGSAASPFENRLYGTELALCQRYFQTIRPIAGLAAGTSNYAFDMQLPVVMRTIPSVSCSAAIVCANGAAIFTGASTTAITGASSGAWVQLNTAGFAGALTANAVYIGDASSGSFLLNSEL